MIKDDIQKEILINLKEKKVTELKVYRFILSEIKYAEINKQKDLTDEEIISLLQKEVKKRKEAIDLFRKGGRQDLVNDEEAQVAIIGKYLPRQMSEEDINKVVDEALNEISDRTNIGRIIGAVMAKLKGQADGAKVAELVRNKLNGS